MAKLMKESGVDWIGAIPEQWHVKKIKNIFYVYSGATPKSGVDEYWDGDIKWITPADYKTEDKYVYGGKRCISKSGYDSCGTTLVDENSIIFSKRAPIGTVAVTKDKMCTNQGCLSCVNKENDSVDYYYYLFSIATKEFEILGTGTTFKEISFDNFINVKVPVPEIDTQHKIVEFLDYKVGEINAIISKTKESIEEYKKYKQAVITEVALGGLDKSVATRNSGIDWIGNIPEHWKIKPFKFVMTERNEKNIPVKTDERLALSIDKGITTYAEKTTNLDRFKDDVTQYKLAYEGDLVFNSMNMIVGAIGYSNYFGCVSPVYYTYFDNVEGHYTSKYYEYIFRSKTMRKVLFSLGKGIMAIDRGDDKINTCRLKVSRDDLRCLKVPVPTEQEQQEIVKYLDAKCAEIDALIAKKEAFVEEMEAYKKSLIYEYVTGKKEVK